MKVPSSFTRARKPRIEMLPLIDIVFLLLIFFIYAMLSMAVHKGMDLSLPVSSTAEIDTGLHLAVSVRENGDLFLENRKIGPTELETVLQDRVLRAPDPTSVRVELFADRTISYQELYHVLDLIRTAGVSNVSLQAGTAE